MDLQEKIAMSNNLDGNAAEAFKLLLKNAPTPMASGLEHRTIEQTNRQNILFYKGKNYIPGNTELRHDIVKAFHDHGTAGHPGEIGTYNAVRQHHWWPRLRTFVKNYIQRPAIQN